MAKNVHLTIHDRLIIEEDLNDGMNFRQIAAHLEKDPSTISKEIKHHIKIIERKGYNPCIHRKNCGHLSDLCDPCLSHWAHACKKCKIPCFNRCPDFKELICRRLIKPPYVFNGCGERKE